MKGDKQMQIIPRMLMRGNAKEAIELYKEALGATADYIMTYGSVGAGSEAEKDLIMNSQIDIKGNKFHLADHKPDQVTSGNQITFTISMDTAEEVKEIFNKIKEGGNIVMEPVETFFSPCHCMIVDKFGIMWQINCPKK
jgi:PhnB protein